ncbi:leucine-rich repeat-containing protein 43-like [Macrosteles quadrilineatus]|uniref:leucine-rich repeat-containing protein 43-like n=1 Tax=Macrosteles quadrilineatus TaxID=74068 RepID=UPI0023E29177|nr:leucine-rich repeat-containing protein 43-like [Macrosteles quadrilineatus]
MDDSLRGLVDLEVLVLAGNCLLSCTGVSLPRRLMVLELCSNRLTDITSLADNSPPLLYLGLARNRLTSGVLEPLRMFEFLYHLDLAQNNIEDMTQLVTACSQLKNLSSLVLIGNPCSMSPNYPTYIMRNIPKLIFLDGELLKDQKPSDGNESDLEQDGTLQIYLFRLMGVPQPHNKKINNKKVTHSFRLEFELPILQQYIINREPSFLIDESQLEHEEIIELDRKNYKTKNNKQEKGKLSEIEDKSTKGKSKKLKNHNKEEINKTSKKSKSDAGNQLSSVKSKKGKKSLGVVKNSKTPETKITNESEEIVKYKLQLTLDQGIQECFKSQRKSWGKIIEFESPAIEVSNCDLWSLRDVFRSDLTLRVVHLMTSTPVSKGKSKQKRGKDDSLKRNGVSEGNLQYAVKKKKESKTRQGEDKSRDVQLIIPSAMTCHIGIGIKRNTYKES